MSSKTKWWTKAEGKTKKIKSKIVLNKRNLTTICNLYLYY